MIKSEMVQKIANANQHLSFKEVEQIVNVIFEEIVQALSRGDRVELRGFGTFSVKHRQPKKARNPGTGEIIYLDERYVPTFKPAKKMRLKVLNTLK